MYQAPCIQRTSPAKLLMSSITPPTSPILFAPAGASVPLSRRSVETGGDGGTGSGRCCLKRSERRIISKLHKEPVPTHASPRSTADLNSNDVANCMRTASSGEESAKSVGITLRPCSDCGGADPSVSRWIRCQRGGAKKHCQDHVGRPQGAYDAQGQNGHAIHVLFPVS